MFIPPSPNLPLLTASFTDGVETLSTSNRVLLIVTIVLFFSLSGISGRVIWKQYAARRAILRARTSSGNDSSSASSSAMLKPSYPHGSQNSFTGIGASGMLPSTTPNAATTSTSSHLLEDEGFASASTGAEMRQRLFLLLFVASTLRVCSLVTEVVTLSAVANAPATSFYTRLLTVFLWLPSIVFVTMYGLVLLFWATLCYACWGKAYPWPRRVFFLFNVLLYGAFIALAVISKTSGGLWRAYDLMVGCVHFTGLFVMLYYSIRLIYFFRHQSPDEDFFFDLPMANNNAPSFYRSARTSPRQIVLRRITAVCILLCVMFSVKAIYLLGMGSGYVPSEESQYRSPVGVGHIAYEFAMHFSTEFVPCALLIFFTRQQDKKSSPQQEAQFTTATPASVSGNNSFSNKPVTPNYSYRMKANGLHGSNGGTHQYQEDTTPMLSGYQYQASQRAYGSTSSSNLRSSNSSGAFLLETMNGGAFGASGTKSTNTSSNNSNYF